MVSSSKAYLRDLMQILEFYASMGMQLPDKPPLLLVEPSALESAEAREGRHDTISHNSEAPVRNSLQRLKIPICTCFAAYP